MKHELTETQCVAIVKRHPGDVIGAVQEAFRRGCNIDIMHTKKKEKSHGSNAGSESKEAS